MRKRNGPKTRRASAEMRLADERARQLREVRSELSVAMVRLRELEEAEGKPIPLFLTCPGCNGRHIDEGFFATHSHTTHACQHCGLTWRPAIVPTVGVQYLPGFKNT